MDPKFERYLILEGLFGEHLAHEITKFIFPTVIYVMRNGCHGGFGMSIKAYNLYQKKLGIPVEKVDKISFDFFYPNRDDPIAIEVFRELGEEANDIYARIFLVPMFKEFDQGMTEYDGIETGEPIYENKFIKRVEQLLDDRTLTDRQKILLMRQEKREIAWAKEYYSKIKRNT